MCPRTSARGDLAGREHYRSDRECERAHRHEQKVLQGRLENWPAAGERVSGRAAGRRHDGTVRVDHTHALSADVDLQAQDMRLARMVNHHLVEADLLDHAPAFSRQRDLEHGPFLDPV